MSKTKPFPLAKIHCLLVLWGLLVWIYIPLAAQPIPDTLSLRFNLIGAKEGLSQGMVTGIVQDSKGFMWFATKDGLNRYDGYEMKVFRHDPKDPYSLPANKLTGIAIDKNGNFWIATANRGLWRMQLETERFYPFAMPNQLCETIIRLKYQNQWLMVTDRRHFYVLDTRKIKPEFGSPKTPNEQKTDIQKCLYFKGNIIFAHQTEDLLPDGSVVTLHLKADSMSRWKKGPNGIEVVKFPPLLTKGSEFHEFYTRHCYHVKDNGIWQARNTDIICREPEGGKIRHRISFSPTIENTSFSIFSGKKDHIYIQLSPQGQLWRLNTQTLNLSLITSNFPKSSSLYGIFIDHDENEWFGTSGDGVAMLSRLSGRFHQSFNNRFIYNLSITPEQEVVFQDIKTRNMIWFNPSNGSSKIDINPFKITEAEVFTPLLVEPNSGKIWKNQISSIVSHPSNPQNPGNRIKLPCVADVALTEPLLFIDSLKRIWRIESNLKDDWFLRCIDLYHLASVKTYQFPVKSISDPLPFVSHYEKIGNLIWLTTTQGVFSFDVKAEKWIHHYQHKPEDPHSLSGNTVLSICPDPVQPQQFLWLGTSGNGLNKMELSTGKCTRFTKKDGLQNEVIYGLLSDEAGNLWLSTNNGLCCFSPPKKEDQKALVKNFTEEDGLANNEFNRYSYKKTANGNLFFGGINGLTWFSPKEVLKPSTPPRMAITGFSIFNSPVHFKTDSQVVSQPFPFAKQINLRHNQSMFRIDFASLDFGPKTAKKYEFQLKGYDDNWIPANNLNAATFTNLDPGHYTFRVKGTNADGIWSLEDATINIFISPPWWGTWWFRTLAVCLFFGLIYGAYRYQLGQAIKLLKLRNRIALDLHDEIGSTLNSISFFGEVARQMMAEDDRAKPVIMRMSTHAKEVVESMSDIVWSLNSKNDSFENLVDRLHSFASQILEPKGCQIEFQRPEKFQEIKLDLEQRRNLYLIVKEAINNVAKYAEATKLWVNFNHSSHELAVEIGDNGKGFDPNKIATGNGLESMECRAKSLKAKWKIDSELGIGTRILLSFKI